MGWILGLGNGVVFRTGSSTAWSSYWASQKICLTGDSIAHGMDAEGPNYNVAELIAAVLGCQQVSIAYPGEGTVEQQVRWDALTAEEKLSFDFIININGNNIASNPGTANAVSVEFYQNFMDVMRADIKSSCKIVCCTMIPAAAHYDELLEEYDHADVVLKRETFNESIRGEGEEAITGQDLLVVSHTTDLSNGDYDLAEEYWANGWDTLHPNEAGRQVIADAVIKILRQYAEERTIRGSVSSLSVTAHATEGCNLSWDVDDNNFDYTSIERSTDGVNFAYIGKALNGIKTYYDKTAEIDLLYYYRVRGVKGSNYSAYSNVDSATTAPLEVFINDGNAFGYWDALDESTVTKDESNIVSSVANKMGGVIALGTGAGLWSATEGIIFNGTDQYLKTGAQTLNLPVSVYLVLKQKSWTQYDRILDGNGDGSYTIRQDVATPQIVVLTSAGYTAGVSLTIDSFGVLKLRTRNNSSANGSNFKLDDNDAITYTGSASNPSGITIGNRGNLGSPSNIAFRKLVVRSGYDTDYMYAKIGTYMQRIAAL